MTQTLLIVDDEAAARFALKRAFQSQYEVTEADSVEAARQQIRKEQPDVILLDYTMPGEDGMALLREIGGSPESPSIIMMTAFGSERVAVEAHARVLLQWPADMPQRSTVRRSSQRKNRFSTSRPIRITVSSPAKTRSEIISKRFW